MISMDRIGYLERDPSYQISTRAVNGNLTCDMRQVEESRVEALLAPASGGNAVGGM